MTAFLRTTGYPCAGIGLIERVCCGSEREPSHRVIHYRVGSNTGGSLTGSPFEAGELLDGFFFEASIR